jgi:chromosome segregation ATPase
VSRVAKRAQSTVAKLREARKLVEAKEEARARWMEAALAAEGALKSVNASLEAANATIASAKRDLASSDQVLASQEKDIAALRLTVDEQSKGLKAREGTIAALGHEVELREAQIDRIERELRAAHRALVKLTHGATIPQQSFDAQAPVTAGAPRT